MKALHDDFYETFPVETDTGHACFIDSIHGDDNCVWDDNKPEDCSVASSGVEKDKCPHWKPTSIPAMYHSDDIWKWLELRLDNPTGK